MQWLTGLAASCCACVTDEGRQQAAVNAEEGKMSRAGARVASSAGEADEGVCGTGKLAG